MSSSSYVPKFNVVTDKCIYTPTDDELMSSPMMKNLKNGETSLVVGDAAPNVNLTDPDSLVLTTLHDFIDTFAPAIITHDADSGDSVCGGQPADGEVPVTERPLIVLTGSCS
jgi:hypothetical protein